MRNESPGKFTIGEIRWPTTPEFSDLGKILGKQYSSNMLHFVWSGYELLLKEVLSEIDFSKSFDQIERTITEYLTPRIRRCMTGNESYDVEQGVYEYESRKPIGQPPLYDLAFVLISNPNIKWPLEAKVLETENTLTEYINEVLNNYIPCRYAPFVDSGGMLGYLLSGNPDQVFSNLNSKTGWTFNKHIKFKNLPHKTSSHTRNVPEGKPYPPKFLCHHLIFKLS